MSNRPDLLPSNVPSNSASPAQSAKTESKSRTPLWILRAELFLRVVIRIYVGILVFLLPWSRFWDRNPLFLAHPGLGEFAAYGAVRGIISGLGLLNLWIAITDAIYHREN
jgi:hypothetical protein